MFVTYVAKLAEKSGPTDTHKKNSTLKNKRTDVWSMKENIFQRNV